MVVSLAIHAVVIVVAILVVVAKVIIPEDPDFQIKKVKRPKMPPKKIQVPVDVKKRKPKPRLRQRIVVKQKTLTDIKMPEISGIKGGLGNMGGDGIGGIGFDMQIGDLFGGNKSMGNELTGTFYDLKQTNKGQSTKMNQGRFYAALASFAKGWNKGRLDDFYQAPKKKYASFFMIPTISSSRVTKAFGVSETVKPVFWAAYYEGYISAPETGRYRFQGYGDDILLVRINKRLVIDASYEPYRPSLHTGWRSDAKNNRKYPIGSQRLFIGDWFKLTKGKPVRMEVLMGDVGNISSFRLLIEKEGAQYKQASYSYKDGDETKTGTRPVLPVFKTKEIPSDPKLIGQMKINSNQVTLEGPSFGAAEKKSY